MARQLSEAVAFSVVQRENGLQQVRKMLEDGEGNVKRTAVALVRNICRYQELHPFIGTGRPPQSGIQPPSRCSICDVCCPQVKQVLSELVWMLPGGDGDDDDCGDGTTAASVCLILNHLSLNNRQHVGAIVKEGALPRIVGVSRRDGGSVAGGRHALLHSSISRFIPVLISLETDQAKRVRQHVSSCTPCGSAVTSTAPTGR